MIGTMIRRDGGFKDALRSAMQRAGLTQAALSRKLSVKPDTVAGWLRGAEPVTENFRQLVALFPELIEFEGGC